VDRRDWTAAIIIGSVVLIVVIILMAVSCLYVTSRIRKLEQTISKLTPSEIANDQNNNMGSYQFPRAVRYAGSFRSLK